MRCFRELSCTTGSDPHGQFTLRDREAGIFAVGVPRSTPRVLEFDRPDRRPAPVLDARRDRRLLSFDPYLHDPSVGVVSPLSMTELLLRSLDAALTARPSPSWAPTPVTCDVEIGPWPTRSVPWFIDRTPPHSRSWSSSHSLAAV